MQQAIDEVSGALRTLGRPDPYGPAVKDSDDFLEPVFQSYFTKLGLRNLMQKTDFHILADRVPPDLIDPEIGGLIGSSKWQKCHDQSDELLRGRFSTNPSPQCASEPRP